METLPEGWFRPELFVLAEAAGELVGFALATAHAPEDETLGRVEELGVRRDWRGRGLASAMLAESFARLQALGRAGACLGVDSTSETGANRLYERAGMRAVKDFVVYEREIRPPSAG